MDARRHFLTFGAALWLAASPAGAEDAPAPAPTLAEYCAGHPCRTETHEIRLIANDGGSFGVMTQTYPYVDGEGSIVIYAGEAIAVSFPDPNDFSKVQFLRTMQNMDEAGAAPGAAVLTVELKQRDGQAGMMMKLRNATGVALKFEATMYVPARDGLHSAPTSMCTLLPGMFNTEGWPHPVAMIVLSHVRKVDVASGGISCS